MPPTGSRRFTWLALAGLALLSASFWADCLLGANAPLAAEFLAAMEPWRSETTLPPPRYQWDPLQWDGVAQFYPWRLFVARSLRRGEIPLWNPHQFCGYPLLANGQSAVFYPPNWLLALVDVRWGLGLLAALHYFFAGSLTYLFARTLRVGHAGGLVAAVGYSFGGFMVTWTELPSLMNSATWLPGCLLGVAWIFEHRRGAVLLLSGALALTVLAGHLQIAAYVWLVTAVYALARALWALVNRQPTRVGALAGAAAVAVLLAGGQLLPTVELARNSTRGLAVPSVAGFEGFHQPRALQPHQLVTLVRPNALGTPAHRDHAGTRYGLPYTEHCGFVGITTLLLAVIGLGIARTRHFAFFLVMAVAGLNVAMGGPLAKWLYLHVPVLGQAGGFSRFLSVYTFAIAMAGGLGLDALCRVLRDGWRSKARQNPDALAPGQSAQVAALGRLRIPRQGIAACVGAVAVVVLACELLPWGHEFLPRCRRDQVYPMTETIAQLQQVRGRVLEVTARTGWGFSHTPLAVLPPNSATVYEYDSVGGYDSLFPRNYRQFVFAVEGGEPAPAANGNMLLPSDRPLWALVGVTDRVTLTGHRAEQIQLALPRAFVPADSAPWVGGANELIRWASAHGKRLQMHAAADYQRPSACQAMVQLPRLEGEGLLVVTETYYPGWRIYVDQKRRMPIQVAGAFLGVMAQPGDRQVTLVFVPASVQVGVFASLIGLALWAGVMSARPRRRQVGR